MRTALVALFLAAGCLNTAGTVGGTTDDGGGAAALAALQARVDDLAQQLAAAQKAITELQTGKGTSSDGGSTDDTGRQIAALAQRVQMVESRFDTFRPAVEHLLSGADDLGRIHGRDTVTLDVDGRRMLVRYEPNSIYWSGANCIGQPYFDATTRSPLPYEAIFSPDGKLFTIGGDRMVTPTQSVQTLTLTNQSRCDPYPTSSWAVLLKPAMTALPALDWSALHIAEQ